MPSIQSETCLDFLKSSTHHVAPPKPNFDWCLFILPGLVRDPFFVDVFVQPGQHPHHLTASCAQHNVTAHSIQHVNWLGFSAKKAEHKAKDDESDIKMNTLTNQKALNSWYKSLQEVQNEVSNPFLPGLPWSCGESVGFGGERSDRTDIDNVAWHLRHEHLFYVRPNLQVVSSSCRSQIFNTCDLTSKTTKNTQWMWCWKISNIPH